MLRLLTALTLLASTPRAWAADDHAAEEARLVEELRSLGRRGVWTGADRTYRALVALGRPLPADVHLLGAQASASVGDALQAYLRASRVQPGESEPQQQAVGMVRGFDQWALVSIEGGTSVKLERPELPFAPSERVAIEAAADTLQSTGVFRGLLPPGTYVVDGQGVEIVPSTSWQVLRSGSP